MFELEDYASGLHDGFLNKYADSPGPIFDFYNSDSLQDMLDIDIRSEVATLVGGSSELASLVNDLPSTFDHTDSTSDDVNNTSANGITTNYATSWFGGPTWSSSNDYYADVGACVNPISVMPIISSSMIYRSPKTTLNSNGLRNTCSPPNSPIQNKSHLHFSPQQLKITSVKSEDQKNNPTNIQPNTIQRKNSTLESIKKDLSLEMKVSSTMEMRISSTSLINSAISLPSTTSPIAVQSKPISTTSSSAQVVVTPSSNGIINSNGILTTGSNTIKLGPGIGGLTFATNSIAYNKLKQQPPIAKAVPSTTLSANNTILIKRERDSSPINGISTHYTGNQMSAKIIARTLVPTKTISTVTHLQSNSQQTNIVGTAITNPSPAIVNIKPATKTKIPIESVYPKPAYSYSCLIAMALKNSRSGSLPVSEIYSFMCEHFPYFKTAPGGWKNSVRHNLSMSKCFEKVEKPATNGAQRKGCLWTMNPEKIAKMDEEVQKWSRKDPLSIRNAMVFPENLEALERGEMKHGSTSDSDVELDSQSEVEETSDSEELDQDLDETIVETHEMYMEEEEESGPQQHRDFDIEVEDIYDAIDMEDDKDTGHLGINTNDIIEITSSPTSSTDNDYHSPKRARLNVNYSIGPAGELQQFKQQHLPQQHAIHYQRQHQLQSHQILTTASFTPQNRRKMQLVNRIA